MHRKPQNSGPTQEEKQDLEAQIERLLANVNDVGDSSRRHTILMQSLPELISMKLASLGNWKPTDTTNKKLAKICARVVDEIYLHASPDFSGTPLIITLLTILKRPLGPGRAIEFSGWVDDRLKLQEIGKAMSRWSLQREQTQWIDGLRAWGASRPTPIARVWGASRPSRLQREQPNEEKPNEKGDDDKKPNKKREDDEKPNENGDDEKPVDRWSSSTACPSWKVATPQWIGGLRAWGASLPSPISREVEVKTDLSTHALIWCRRKERLQRSRSRKKQRLQRDRSNSHDKEQ